MITILTFVVMLVVSILNHYCHVLRGLDDGLASIVRSTAAKKAWRARRDRERGRRDTMSCV